jgi:hypothetical protein
MIKPRRMRWAGHVAQMREKRHMYRLLVGKRPLVRPRRRWMDNIKMYFGDIGIGGGGIDWIGLVQDSVTSGELLRMR